MRDTLKRDGGAHANRRMRKADTHSYAKWRYYFWDHMTRLDPGFLSLPLSEKYRLANKEQNGSTNE